jgi:hypothetical protein
MDIDELLARGASLNPRLEVDVDSAYSNVARRSRRRRRLRWVAMPILALALAGAVAESVALTSDSDNLTPHVTTTTVTQP